jgi:putative flavoprotein involved in K+ transport
MPTTDTVVIGAGHAGLAVSRLLSDAGRDHVVLDRGRIAERWLSERWDSLHLLTPRWMTRLPGWHYAGPASEGFMPVAELVEHLRRYAASFSAPVQTGTTVLAVTTGPRGYRVATDHGTWHSRNVVVATGPWGRPRVPAGLEERAADLFVTTSSRYRRPDALPDGGVLVVGASSSGVQIADELARSGRRVVLAAGGHSRMPRRYRGLDIFWWLERTGRLGRTIEDVADPGIARAEPSLQLVGRPGAPVDLDLGTLQARGVRVTGRLLGLIGHRAHLGQGVERAVADADRRLRRLLDDADRYADQSGLSSELWAPDRPAPVEVAPQPDRLDLAAEQIGTVLLATGYRPHHPWLRLPVTAPDGSIVQRRGVTASPGLYVVGQRFQHRRDSGFIDGARHDAAFVVDHLCSRPSSHAATDLVRIP